MKLPVLLAATLSVANLAQAQEVPIRASDVQADVTFLADDLLLGREPGTPGFDIAARFVAARYQALGLKPAGADGTYYQPVTFREARLAGPPAVTLRYGGRAMAIAPDRALLRASLTDRAVAISAPLVFAGFGIDRADLGQDDYRGIDARGKVVVVLSGYPKGVDSELGAFLGAEKTVMAMRRGGGDHGADLAGSQARNVGPSDRIRRAPGAHLGGRRRAGVCARAGHQGVGHAAPRRGRAAVCRRRAPARWRAGAGRSGRRAARRV